MLYIYIYYVLYISNKFRILKVLRDLYFLNNLKNTF